ncbi:GNAT family N-acetyltransferase [Streptomyces sp. NPDC059900]|uniref:GNAT family N-acetyltransferase n=1 Tax=Streptomyces sp. NPDC059900 TaxID=3155816 RepID=UPI003436ADD2
MSSSGIEIRDDRARGVLEARADGEVVGKIVYFTLDAPEPALVPVHTEVQPAHEGEGIAGAMARELYAMAAREAVAIAPLCPYVVKWAERHPQEAPVPSPELAAAARDRQRSEPTTW